ncbi:hypothetical protein [Arsenicicoccus sp. oral taxon 190]|uniref:hypothetical protein n=1 Tax=Arsenicicoccus sp. oral taxon 190 TaxID=1658671 RepID=UPI00155DD3C5|nr:hypothetical protein [Arsenicicoccus sp. oral taxon 190]
MDGREVAACAAQLERHARDMEEAAVRIEATAAAMDWESPAAEAARRQVTLLTDRLRSGAEQVREAAASVRAHGIAASAAWAELARASAEVGAVAAAGVAGLRRAMELESPGGLVSAGRP